MLIKRISFYDFDSTLIHSPQPINGKKQWEKIRKTEYPHIGWWSKPESLDLGVFDIKPIELVINLIRRDINDSNTLVVILTSRLEKLRKEIKAVLDNMGIYPDIYDLKNDGRSKGEKVLNYIDKHPNLERVDVYDDNYEREIVSYLSIIDEVPKHIKYNIYHVVGDEIKQINENSTVLNIIRDEIINYKYL